MKKLVIILTALLLLVLPLLAACDGGDDKTTATVPDSTGQETPITSEKPEVPNEPVKIVIGMLTDLTGPGATALEPMKMAVEDMVRYVNDDNYIPGVEIELFTYDTQYDASRDIPGYEWLKEKGAKIVFTPQPHTTSLLKTPVEEDRVPICTWAAITSAIEPPGWVFCAGIRTAPMARTMLDWISTQWQHYPVKPKIGTTGSAEPIQMLFSNAVKEYCQDHPELFDYVGDYLAPFGTVTWTTEVAELKDCDYIGMQGATIGNATFVNELRQAGSAATVFSLDAMGAAAGLFIDNCGWDALDGTLALLPWSWWGDDSEPSQLAEELLSRYRTGDREDIIRSGHSYLAVHGPLVFFDVIREAVATVGAENFDGQAFYDTATGFQKTYNGFTKRQFTETSRHFAKEGVIWEWSAELEDLARVSDWLVEKE